MDNEKKTDAFEVNDGALDEVTGGFHKQDYVPPAYCKTCKKNVTPVHTAQGNVCPNCHNPVSRVSGQIGPQG